LWVGGASNGTFPTACSVSAGTITGSETFKKVADGYYVSEIEATGRTVRHRPFDANLGRGR